jgi:hypothetical protein
MDGKSVSWKGVDTPHGVMLSSLERLADRDGKSVDAVLPRELLDVVCAHSEYLATAIQGFTPALRWPQ